MKDLLPSRSASVDRARDTARSVLSRREFLVGASTVGGMALASAALAQRSITTPAAYAKSPPYGNNTLPAGVRPRLV